MSARIIKFSEAAGVIKKRHPKRNKLTIIEEYLRKIREDDRLSMDELDRLFIPGATHLPGFVGWYEERFGCEPPQRW